MQGADWGTCAPGQPEPVPAQTCRAPLGQGGGPNWGGITGSGRGNSGSCSKGASPGLFLPLIALPMATPTTATTTTAMMIQLVQLIPRNPEDWLDPLPIDMVVVSETTCPFQEAVTVIATEPAELPAVNATVEPVFEERLP